jgi:hypothetical protein
MKTLLNLIVLVAIVFAYILSASIYEQGNLILAYSLILTSLATLVFWINAISHTDRLIKAKA